MNRSIRAGVNSDSRNLPSPGKTWRLSAWRYSATVRGERRPAATSSSSDSSQSAATSADVERGEVTSRMTLRQVSPAPGRHLEIFHSACEAQCGEAARWSTSREHRPRLAARVSRPFRSVPQRSKPASSIRPCRAGVEYGRNAGPKGRKLEPNLPFQPAGRRATYLAGPAAAIEARAEAASTAPAHAEGNRAAPYRVPSGRQHAGTCSEIAPASDNRDRASAPIKHCGSTPRGVRQRGSTK